MSRVSILHLRASNFYGGPERQLHYHAREAAGSDYQITVSSFSEAGCRPAFLDTIASDGINTHLFSVRNAYDRSAVAKVAQYISDQQIDIFCTHDYRCNIIGYLVAHKTSAIWLPFSRGWTQDNLKVRIYHAFDKFVLRRARQLVAVSRGQKEKLVKAGVREHRITVVPNAIDPGSFASIPPIDLRARFGFEPNTVLCVCGGRFSREKGQIYLVKAALLAIDANPRLRFILFGDGPDLEKIRSAIATSDNADKIICPGFEKSMIGCVKGADILINPSLSEGLPNIVLEAMAVGTPVIATAVGGVPEIISDGQTGFLVPPESPAGIAEKVKQIADDIHVRDAISKTAFDFVSKEYTFSGQFEKLRVLYDLVSSKKTA